MASVTRWLAELPIYLAAVLLALTWLRCRPEEKVEALAIAYAALTLVVLNLTIRHLYFHPRPFAMGVGCSYLNHEANSSFPSNHLGIIFACAVAAWGVPRFRTLSVFVFFLCVPIAWTRVYAGVHWPFDMLGALVTGGVSGRLGLALAHRLRPARPRR